MSTYHIRRDVNAFTRLGVVKACLFDLDGLLLQTELISKVIWHSLAAVLCPEKQIQLSDWLKFNGVPKAGKKELGVKIFGNEELFTRADELRDRLMLEITLGFGIPVKAGAPELLQMLRSQGIPVIVVTAAPDREAWAKLTTSKLGHLIDGMVAGDSGTNKVALYQAGAKEADVNVTDCLAFEDSPKGGKSALESGARLVVVRDLDPLHAFAELMNAPNFVGFFDSMPQITEVLRQVFEQQRQKNAA